MYPSKNQNKPFLGVLSCHGSDYALKSFKRILGGVLCAPVVVLPSMLARVCVSRNIRIHFFAFLYVNGIEWPEPKKPPQAATCKGYGLYFPAIGPF